MLIHLCAKNGTNGNPRRLYLQIINGISTQAWDEGYKGHHSVPKRLQQQAREACYIETTPAEYKRLLKEYGEPSK